MEGRMDGWVGGWMAGGWVEKPGYDSWTVEGWMDGWMGGNFEVALNDELGLEPGEGLHTAIKNLGRWMEGWKGGRVGGSQSRVKDCLQQSNIKF